MFEDLLGNNPGLTIIGTIFAFACSAFKSSSWWQKRRKRRYAKAVDALEAGVNQTFNAYVNAIKDSRDDGKLSDEEKLLARQLAIQTAQDFAQTEGINVVRVLGHEYMDLWIEKIINRLKRY